jgi:nucleoside-diphosphate-sugar epimerase
LRILVLGASSVIGRDLAAEFAHGNELLLIGRDPARLGETAGACSARGASAVSVLSVDLSAGNAWVDDCVVFKPDAILNAACATSRLGDDDIPGPSLLPVIRADLAGPLELIDRVHAANAERLLSVVFVTTVLALVPSQRRQVYGGLKRMQEHALMHRASRDARLRVTLARICRPISPDAGSSLSAAFARQTFRAFIDGRSELRFGWSGRLAMTLNDIHPLVFRAFIAASRRFRRRKS